MAMLPTTAGGSSYSVTLASELGSPAPGDGYRGGADPGDLVTLSAISALARRPSRAR